MPYNLEEQPYMYYKQNNTELYDDYNTPKPSTYKEAILLKCIKCHNTYREAYKCNKEDCPLYNFRKKWMKRPHTASQAFLDNRINISEYTKL